ncbi:MAG: ATP-binding cassette domain-containing protein [Methanocalculaceae archaeon]|jgi:ABC-type lipoprotein export system ATPase subunit|nr:ATP-binding cassette domain-containing protein [Methanocalculaceae archaeon]
MINDLYDRVTNETLQELIADYPIVADFFINYNLQNLENELPFSEALNKVDENILIDFGLNKTTVLDQLVLFLQTVSGEEQTTTVQEITILGGQTKSEDVEEFVFSIKSGEIISIVGPTGSGKSRFLADIECLAQRDTPTKRQILVNGRALEDEERFVMDGRLVAQLSQNMNFVMDLSVGEFLEMHAKSRLHPNPTKVVAECFAAANELVGEKFTLQTKVTQLSGGQSRALMIADTACMSTSPIVLIDEIENAGVDRRQAIHMLAKNEKIVLISTHDPLLALMAGKRLVIKNGGVYKIIETTPEERESLAKIEMLDNTLQSIRNKLRIGDRITPDTI